MSTSAFGHLAQRFSPHPENLATEALCYILGNAPVARDALAAYLLPSGRVWPDTVRFQT